MARNNANFVRLLLIVGIVVLLYLTFRNYKNALNTLQSAEHQIMQEEEASQRYQANKKVFKTFSYKKG
jgi:arginine exporter protein ArgO